MTPRERRIHRLGALLLAISAAGLLGLFGIAMLAVGGCYAVTEPPPVATPPVTPPTPPAFPPPTDPPPATPGLPAVGATKAEVEAMLGKGTDLPENPGEDDAVSYLRTLDGREVEIHVVYRAGVVLRVVISNLVTPGR